MFAQSYVRTTDARNVSVKKSTVTGRETAVPENITPMTRSSVSANFMGTTYYDLQTNGTMPQKIVAHEDGTISAVWTTNANTAASRGTGYNYFDGSTWVNPSYSTARIENVRTGWGTLTCVGNAEIVAAHNGSSALVIGICPQKGTQNWTFTNLVGPSITGINNDGQPATSTALLWPAIASSGNIVHLICCTESDTGMYYQGINTCLVYYRGTFNASSNTIDWESPRIVGNLTSDEVRSMSGDAYAIAAKGNTVAILNAPSTSDVFLWKSNDNGVNFTKTVIVKSPIELYKENTTMVLDTPCVADGSCAVSIDDNGMVHVAFGITRFFNDVLGDGSYSYYPGYDDMLYWNESMQPILSGTKEALNSDSLEAAGYMVFHRNDLTGDGGAYYIQNGDFPGYGVAAVSTPQFVLDNGTVYLIYTQILDFPFINTNEGAYYRGVFATKSSDNGNTWGGVSWLSYNKDCYYISDWSWTALQDTDFTISMMTESIYNEGESVFPAVASKIVNGKINMWWQQDYIPGSEIKESSVSMCQNESSIYHFAIDANQIGIYNNVDEVWQGLWVGISNHNISGMRMYPNPATESVNVLFTAENTENGVLSVMNLMGQTVYTMNIDVNEGTNMVTIPVNQLPAGIYMVNIKTNKGISTQKLIVK
jgi:hypothetical protein